jgi:hypothetical protein
MPFPPGTIAALVIATSFAAGLNVYATLFTLGLLAHWVALPPGLKMLASWWIIGVSGALFAAEFVVDKFPGIDLMWNGLHTFVRIPIAGLLAYRAASQLTPGMQLLTAGMGAVIALTAHGSKTAVRVAVAPNLEPVLYLALSSGEDVAAIGIAWLATQRPWTAASIAILLLLVAVLMFWWAVKTLRGVWRRPRVVPAP